MTHLLISVWDGKRQDWVYRDRQFDQQTITFGRGKDVECSLPNPEKTISRTHGRIIRRDDGSYEVRHLSQNIETRFDNQPLALEEPRALGNGGTITVGADVFRLEVQVVRDDVGVSDNQTIVQSASDPAPQAPQVDPLIAQAEKFLSGLERAHSGARDQHPIDRTHLLGEKLRDFLGALDPSQHQPVLQEIRRRLDESPHANRAAAAEPSPAAPAGVPAAPASPKAEEVSRAFDEMALSLVEHPLANGEEAEQLAERVEVVLNILLDGLARLLEQRRKFLDNTGAVSQTQMTNRRNNPLLREHHAQGLRDLLLTRNRIADADQAARYLKAAIRRIQLHIRGLEAVVAIAPEESLRLLSPENIRARVEGDLGGFLSNDFKRLWTEFEKCYSELHQNRYQLRNDIWPALQRAFEEQQVVRSRNTQGHARSTDP